MNGGRLGKEYTDGEVICRQGEIGDQMYVIQAGHVTVAREVGGTEVLLAELAAGDFFGEMSLFERSPRSATVRAKGRAHVLTLDKRTFLRGVHEDPSLAYRILQQMCKRIRRMTEDASARQQSGSVAAGFSQHWPGDEWPE